MTAIELQFRGCTSTIETLPFIESPFEYIDDPELATTLIEGALMGDDDGDWIVGVADGEDFQVRIHNPAINAEDEAQS